MPLRRKRCLQPGRGAGGGKRPSGRQHFSSWSYTSTHAEADPDLAWRVNMDGMRNVLEAARNEGIAKVILTSSLATYGPGLASLQIDAPMWPTSLYGVTKVAGECLGTYYHQRFGLDFRAIRFPSIVASRGGSARAAGRFTAEVFYEAVANGAYEFYLRPDSSIPIIYIDDAIKALVAFHDAPSANLKRRFYNIHACGVTALELEQVVRARLPQVVIAYNPDSVQTATVDSWPHVFDDSDAPEDWGWQETYDLERMADEVSSILQREKHEKNLPRYS